MFYIVNIMLHICIVFKQVLIVHMSNRLNFKLDKDDSIYKCEAQNIFSHFVEN